MPVVPRTERLRVQQQALPSVRVPTQLPEGAFGANQKADLGQALVGVQQTINNIHLEEQKKADDTFGVQSLNEAEAEKMRLLYDPEQGALKFKGQSALQASQKAAEKYQSYLEDLKGKANNSTQQMMLEKIASNQMQDIQGVLSKHDFTESQSHYKTTREAGILTARESATLNQDVANIETQLMAQMNYVKDLAQAEGYDENSEYTQIKQREAVSKTHFGVVRARLDASDDMGAKKYYEQVQATMTADDRHAIEPIMKAGTIKGESRRLADSLLQKNKGSYPDALKELKGKKDLDTDVFDQTRDRLEKELSDQKRVREADEEETYRKNWELVDRSPNVDVRDLLSATDYTRLGPKGVKQLYEWSEFRRKGIEPEANGPVYYQYLRTASDPKTREQFARKNIHPDRVHMTTAEWKELAKTQADILKGDANNEKKLDDFRTKQDIYSRALRDIKRDPTPKDNKHADWEFVNRFRRKLAEQESAMAQSQGKPLTNQQFEDLAQKLAQEVVVEKGFFRDTRKSVMDLGPGEEILEIEIDSIPSDIVNDIKTELKSNGFEPTDDAVIKVWSEELKRGR